MNFGLIKNDLIALLKAHKLLFIILISGIIASFFTFEMMVGLVQYKIEKSKDFSMLNAFSIDFGAAINDSDKKNIEHILNDDENLRTALLVSVFDDKPMLVGWKGENDNRWFVLDEGRFFYQTEVSNKSNVVVVSAGLYNEPDFDYKTSRFTIGNNEFQIIGIGILPANGVLFIGQEDLYQKYYLANKTNYYHAHEENEEDEQVVDYAPIDSHIQTEIIPFTTYQKLGYQPNIIRLEYRHDNLSTYNKKIDELLVLFPNSTIYAPQPPKQFYSSEMMSKIIQAILLMIFALVNIAALFVYWLAVNKHVHTIYSICGANKKDIFLLIAIEWGIIVIIAFLASFLLQIFIYPLIKALHISFEFSILQNAFILAGGYFLTMVFIAPQIIKNIHLDIRGYAK